MSSAFLEITTIMIIFVCTLLAMFLLTVKNANRLANQFLGTYFLVFAVHISAFVYAKYIVLPINFELLRDHIAFLSSPLLFLYVVCSIYSDFKLAPRHLCHLVPFILQILLFSPRFYFADISTSRPLLENLNDTFEGQVSIIFGLLVALFYLLAIFVELRKYRRLLMENYANQSTFNYDWLYQLFILLSAIFCLSVMKQIYQLFGSDIAVLSNLRLMLTTALIGFLSWIVLKSMHNPDLFRNINTQHLLVKDIVESEAGTHSNSEDSQSGEQGDKLTAFMHEQAPYLDATLTIQKLADSFGASHRDLSILINHHLNQHFFDFVNGFRIDKAKQLLLDNGDKKLTISQIMYDVGFNSKSSFYAAFKKQTGLTPSAYRKQQ